MGGVRCPDCCKFASLEFQEPSVDVEITSNEDSITVTAEAYLERTCEDCGTTLKEANLNFSKDLLAEDFGDHWEAVKDRLDELKLEDFSVDALEEGGGRYAKSFFGATVQYKISLDDIIVFEGELEDKISASEMDTVE